MSIRNEFEKIDPTEKQKKDIFRRIEESSKVKTDFRHQVIRYTSCLLYTSDAADEL